MINLSILNSFEVFSLFSMYKVKMLNSNYEIDFKTIIESKEAQLETKTVCENGKRKEVKNNFKKTWTLQKCCMLLSTRTKY